MFICGGEGGNCSGGPGGGSSGGSKVGNGVGNGSVADVANTMGVATESSGASIRGALSGLLAWVPDMEMPAMLKVVVVTAATKRAAVTCRRGEKEGA